MEQGNKNSKLFKKIEENMFLKVIVCIVLSSVAIILFLLLNKYLNFKESRKYTVVDDINLINSIENISINDGMLELDGYAFLLDQDSTNSSISLLLREVDNGDEMWVNVNKIKRPDVKAYFNSEYNFEDTGFQAFVENDKLNNDMCYEILINIDYKDNNHKIRKTVSSNTFILNSVLYDYNPYNFAQPNVNIASELLRNVFSNGRLCFYQKEAGMYVYQYEGKLYWIATEDFIFNENRETYIVYQLHTTEIDKLPDDRIQYEFDNLDFHFEEYEYKAQITEPYRVAIRDIPDGYVISYIRTGVYNIISKQWFWNKLFHLKNMN